MKRSFEVKLKEIKDLTELQGRLGNFNYDNYMLGMYNGMELCLSILEEREPKYRNQTKHKIHKYRIAKVR